MTTATPRTTPRKKMNLYFAVEFRRCLDLLNRGILVYNICLISISNSVYDEVTNKSVLNIERS